MYREHKNGMSLATANTGLIEWLITSLVDNHIQGQKRLGAALETSMFYQSSTSTLTNNNVPFTWVIFELDLLHQSHVGRPSENPLNLQTWHTKHTQNTEEGRSEWENDLFRELKSKLISALCLCFHQHEKTVPCSVRKVMVSLITTGTQSPSGLLCLSLTHKTADIVRSWLGFYHLAFTPLTIRSNVSICTEGSAVC